MTTSLNNAAMGACVAMLRSIEGIEEIRGESGLLGEIQFNLVKAYHELTDALSRVSGADAHKVSRNIIISEIESLRALVAARTGE
jgi:hypothetical protein